MNSKNKTFLIAFLLVIIGASLYCIYRPKNQININDNSYFSQPVNNQATISTSTIPNLMTFINAKYNYSLKYKSNLVKITTSNDYGLNDLSNQDDISFYIPGENTLLELEVANDNSEDKTLDEYTKYVYSLQSSNSSIEVKKGVLTKSKFKGSEIYTFTLSGAAKLYNKQYTLGEGNVYMYIIANTKSGKKIVIHYLISDKENSSNISLAKDMFDSLEL